MTSDRVIKMSLIITEKCPSRGYIHSVDQNTRSIATPGMKHFTLNRSIWKQVHFHIKEFKKTTTKQKQTKSFNEQNNGCARALKIFVNFFASSEKQQRGMTKLYVVWRTWTTTANFF